MRFKSIPLLSTSSWGSHTAEYTSDRLSFLRRAAEECGALGRVNFRGRDILIANSPGVIHEILVDKARSFRKWPLVRLALFPLAGDGLFTSEGSHWKTQRRRMAPVFGHEQIGRYAGHMTDAANRAAHRMHDGELVRVAEATTQIAMSVVGRALFGTETFDEAGELAHALTAALKWSDAQSSSLQALLQVVARELLERVAQARPGRIQHAAERALRVLETPLGYRLSWPGTGVRGAVDIVDARIAHMIASRRAAQWKRTDLVTQLMRARAGEGGRTMSDRQLRDEAVTLFVAGHETAANGLAWAIYELAKDPATYALVLEEADRFAGQTPTLEQLPQLSNCARVFKEALRMYPPICAYGRQALTDLVLGGYEVPAGTYVVASAYGLHYNPTIYPNPERFDPNRFAPEVEAARPRSAWLPFGNGPRTCIGMHFALLEGQLVLAALSNRIRFEPEPGVTVRPEPGLTLRPSGGMPMIARVRSGARSSLERPSPDTDPRRPSAMDAQRLYRGVTS